jgi:hypothetical protein
MAASVMAEIEGDRVAGQKSPHELAKISGRWPKQHMNMVAHQRPRQAFHGHLRQEATYAVKESLPVIVVLEYVPLFNPSHDYMLEDSGYV